MRTRIRHLAALATLAAALITPATASAAVPLTSSGAAYADAQHWARYVCPPTCLAVYGSAIYDVNPGAHAGQIQWNTYTNERTNYLGRCEIIQIYAGFGPFSGSGTATPLAWNSYFVKWC